MACSERFNFESFDEQMEEALAENERAMSQFIIKHSNGLEQAEIDYLIEQGFIKRIRGDEGAEA